MSNESNRFMEILVGFSVLMSNRNRYNKAEIIEFLL
jgi:hypothetical protein